MSADEGRVARLERLHSHPACPAAFGRTSFHAACRTVPHPTFGTAFRATCCCAARDPAFLTASGAARRPTFRAVPHSAFHAARHATFRAAVRAARAVPRVAAVRVRPAHRCYTSEGASPRKRKRPFSTWCRKMPHPANVPSSGLKENSLVMPL